MNIVDLPINSMVIFHSYVNVYQRVVYFSHVVKPIIFNPQPTSITMWIPFGGFTPIHETSLGF